MFFMWFWPFIVLNHPSQFLLVKGFALLHWHLFSCTWRQSLKDPFFYFTQQTYPLQTICESLLWMNLDPPPPTTCFILLTFLSAFPTDVKTCACMKQVRNTVKNLLKIFSLQTSWEERGNKFYWQIGGFWVLYGNIVLAPCEGVRKPISIGGGKYPTYPWKNKKTNTKALVNLSSL